MLSTQVQGDADRRIAAYRERALDWRDENTHQDKYIRRIYMYEEMKVLGEKYQKKH